MSYVVIGMPYRGFGEHLLEDYFDERDSLLGDDCNGTVVSPKHGFCCPAKTWTNGVYRNALGWYSLTYWNERRVRSILSVLTAVSKRGFPSAMHEFAYDHGLDLAVAVPPSLAERVGRANTNYHAIFPAGRWVKKLDVAKLPQCTKETFDVYTTRGLTPAEQAARDASLRAIGVDLASTKKWGDSVLKGVVARVPSGRYDNEGVIQGPGHIGIDKVFVPGTAVPKVTVVPAADRPVAPKPGKVNPTKWLSDFLDVFAPGTAPVKSVMVSVPARKVAVVKYEPEQDVGAGTVLSAGVLGVGVAAVLGIIWLIKKK